MVYNSVSISLFFDLVRYIRYIEVFVEGEIQIKGKKLQLQKHPRSDVYMAVDKLT
jgi:hypothetical protein